MQTQGAATSGVTSLGVSPLGGFRTDMEIMSPEDVLAYVALALGNIGKQLESYKAHVQEKQAVAADLNKALAYARDASRAGGNQETFTQAEYDELMKLLDKYPDDENLKAALGQLMNSYGGFTDAAGVRRGTFVMDDGNKHGSDTPKIDEQNGHLNPGEWKNVIDHISSSLEQLNSDNEYTMMKLQTLMQQRSQISQFASNMLNSLHENAKAIIGNLRA